MPTDLEPLGCTMTQKMKMLERVFSAEIEGRLPFQARPSKALKLCVDQQLIEPMRIEYPPDRFGPIVVEGWQLTHAGRVLYCSWADENCPDEV